MKNTCFKTLVVFLTCAGYILTLSGVFAELCTGVTNIQKEEIFVGETFNYTCRLNQSSGRNSLDLQFIWHKTLPPELISRPNPWTASLVIPNMTVDKQGPYLCRLGGSGWCHKTFVTVIHRVFPEQPSICVNMSLHHATATIRWKKPVDSHIEFEHARLSYKVNTSDNYADLNKRCPYMNGMAGVTQVPPCNTSLPYPCQCPLWDPITLTCTFVSLDCFYKHARRHYTFLMAAGAGSITTTHRVYETYSFTLSHKYYCLNISTSVSHVGKNSAVIHVSSKFTMMPMVLFRVSGFLTRYNSTISKDFEFLYTYANKDPRLTLPNLQPYTPYTVDIQARHRKSIHWSNTATVNFTTLEDVPNMGPIISPQSFSFIQHNLLNVYWQRVPIESTKGVILGYNLTISTSPSQGCDHIPQYDTDIPSTTTTTTLTQPPPSLFTKHLSTSLTTKDYVVYKLGIAAINSAGSSPVSTISINPENCYTSILNVTAEQTDKSHVVVRWRPDFDDNITYTVHYCAAVSDTFICKSDYSTITNLNQTMITVTYQRDYIYGVSSSESGISWTNCVYAVNGIAEAPYPPTIHTPTSTPTPTPSLTLHWEPLTCSEAHGIIQRYQISVSHQPANIVPDDVPMICDDGKQHYVDPSSNQTDIFNLTTNTAYVFCVRGVTRGGEGAWAYVTYNYKPVVNAANIVAEVVGPVGTVLVLVFIAGIILCIWKRRQKEWVPAKVPDPPNIAITPYTQFSTDNDDQYEPPPSNAMASNNTGTQHTTDTGYESPYTKSDMTTTTISDTSGQSSCTICHKPYYNLPCINGTTPAYSLYCQCRPRDKHKSGTSSEKSQDDYNKSRNFSSSFRQKTDRRKESVQSFELTILDTPNSTQNGRYSSKLNCNQLSGENINYNLNSSANSLHSALSKNYASSDSLNNDKSNDVDTTNLTFMMPDDDISAPVDDDVTYVRHDNISAPVEDDIAYIEHDIQSTRSDDSNADDNSDDEVVNRTINIPDNDDDVTTSNASSPSENDLLNRYHDDDQSFDIPEGGNSGESIAYRPIVLDNFAGNAAEYDGVRNDSGNSNTSGVCSYSVLAERH